MFFPLLFFPLSNFFKGIYGVFSKVFDRFQYIRIKAQPFDQNKRALDKC